MIVSTSKTNTVLLSLCSFCRRSCSVSSKFGVNYRFEALSKASSARSFLSLTSGGPPFSNAVTTPFRFFNRRFHHNSTIQTENFAVLFDIDGVIMSGSHLLPDAKSAIEKLVDHSTNTFKAPVIFVTNSGFRMRQEKADQLNRLLQTDIITEDHVLMSHSPLKLFDQFKQKHCLISGQGQIKKISHALGFEKVTTVEEFNEQFVYLDRLEHLRTPFPACGKPFEQYFPPIEALILFGPPLKWERHLQLMLDVLLSNGHPSHWEEPATTGHYPYPHLPILACNIDLVWKAEIDMPRIAHGAFMHCLEELYKKFTGLDLKYTAICGKPAILTYHHAVHCVNNLARKQLNWDKPVKHLYCIGDNLQSDICGANIYDRHVSKQPKRPRGSLVKKSEPSKKQKQTYNDVFFNTEPVETCYSVLVCTGVYNNYSNSCAKSNGNVAFFAHRDFDIDAELLEPDYVANNAKEAVDLILQLEANRKSGHECSSCPAEREEVDHS